MWACGAPFHDFFAAVGAIDVESDVAGENEEEAFDDAGGAGGEDLAGFEMAEGGMGGDPVDFVAGLKAAILWAERRSMRLGGDRLARSASIQRWQWTRRRCPAESTAARGGTQAWRALRSSPV